MLLRFPRKGLHKGFASEEQMPETSRVLQNVRPYDCLENMARGGQRPALRKAYSQQIGGATQPVLAMRAVKTVNTLLGTTAPACTTGDNTSWTIASALTQQAQSFSVGAIAVTVTSIKLKMYRSGSPGTITLAVYAVDGAGKPTGAALTSGTINGNTFTVDTAGEWYETAVTGYTLSANTSYTIVISCATANAANRFGIRHQNATNIYAGGKLFTSADGGGTWTNWDAMDDVFEIVGTLGYPNEMAYDSQLVAVGNNEVWYESAAGTMEELTDAHATVDITSPITLLDAEQKCFIVNMATYKVADFGNSKISTAGIGANLPIKGLLLTGGTSGAKMYVDFIDANAGACNIYGWRYTSATFVTGETVTGAGSVSFVLSANETAPPVYYTWTPFANDTTTYGTMPVKATGAAYYRGRVVMWGYPPNEWYMSRQLDPWDWNYGETDAGRAIYGGNADAGKVGDIIVAGIPYKDEIFVWGCANSLWYMVGDPADGGSLNELDLTSGLLSSQGWTWDNQENLYLLCTSGLLKITKGFGGIENLTDMRYPDFIKDLAFNPATQRLTLTYDRLNKGLVICRTTMQTGVTSAWWYDLRTDGLFPETYPEECGIMCSYHYESADPTYRKTLYGSSDGYIREFSRDQEDDELTGGSEEAITSYVGLGPFALGDSDGVISNLRAVLGGGASGGTEDSDPVTYKVFTDDTAEEVNKQMVADGTPSLGGTFSVANQGGRSSKSARGSFAGILLKNSTLGQMWAMENVVADVRPTGGRKK